MEIRRLCESDLAAILELAAQRDTYMKIPKADVLSGFRQSWPRERVEQEFGEHLAKELRAYFLNDSFLYQMFGAFDRGGRLLSTFGISLSASWPLWTLSRLLARPGTSLAENGLGELYEHCLQMLEGLGFTDYLTCVPAKHARAYDRGWRTAAPSRYRYLVMTEESVAPGTRPFYAAHFRTMGQVVWPVPMLIRRHSLVGADRERVIANRPLLQEHIESRYGAFAPALDQSALEIAGSYQ